MIGPDVRHAIYQLHQAGMSLREISRRLQVSRKAVRKIVQQQGKFARRERTDKKEIDAALLERLYRECNGWIQRIHERLVEEEGIQIGYSTLTRLLRELGLSRSQPTRCDRVPDEPGAEMQQDTTVYQVKLGEQRTKLIASLIYLRYRIVELATLRRIAWLCLTQEGAVLPPVELDEDFRQRPAYQEGFLTDQPDLSAYDQWSDEDQEEEDEDDEAF